MAKGRPIKINAFLLAYSSRKRKMLKVAVQWEKRENIYKE